MPTRSAKADWQGEFKSGGGSVSTETGVLDSPYNFSGRFESGTGTNPEELLAAAHASCYAMALSGGLARAGTPPEHLAVSAEITFDKVGDAWTVVSSALTVRGRVPGADDAGFRQAAEAARDGCPISRALIGNVTLSVDASLEA
jgi:osmotically inducible protein OsmC